MEDNRKYTLEEALNIVIGTLGGISIPAGLLAVADPEQIMAVKVQVIDPVERSRRNLIELLTAYNDAMRQAAEAVRQESEGHDNEREADPE